MVVHKIKRVTSHLSLWLLILLAIGLSSVRLFFLGIDDYKTDLENTILELTTIPIEIGALRANMRGFNPEIILKDIKVLATDGQKKPPIKLDEVRLGIDLMQLILSRQILPSCWLTLIGAKLSIVRKEDGSLSVVGLNSSDSEQPLWLLKGGRYEVLKSDITWLDKQRHGVTLSFNQVDMLIKNDFETQLHELHLISQLPEKYGEKLRVSMEIEGNFFEPDNLSGTLYIEGTNVNLANLLAGDMPFDIKINTGEGSFKTWSQWHNSKLSTLAGTVQAKKIILKKPNNKLHIQQIETAFNWANTEQGWQFGVSNFLLKTEKQLWPLAEFNISVNEQQQRFAASVTQLDLKELTELARFFTPLRDKTHKLVTKLGLKGMLKDFSGYIDIKKARYGLNGTFEKIYANAYAGLPKLDNLTGDIRGTNEFGMIGLDTKEGALFFSKLYEKPFTIDRLKGLVVWHQLVDKWLMFSDSLILDLKDIQTETKVALVIPKNNDSVFIDLQTSFGNAQDMSKASKYYPVKTMDKGVLNWLEQAFVSGKIEQGNALIYGYLDQFPFADGQGVFEVFFNVADVELKYAPGWPNFKNMTADILFLKDSLSIDIVNAEVKGMALKQTVVEIPSFKKSEHLLVTGKTEGSIVDSLAYLQQTPLHAPIDSLLDVITPKGLTKVELDLKIALKENGVTKVNARADFNDAAFKLKSADLDILNVQGHLNFSEKGLFSDDLKAKTLGFPVAININSDKEQTIINVDGKTDVLQLKQQFGLLGAEILADKWMQGSAAYQLKLTLPKKTTEAEILEIKTDLQGMAINLPGLLAKSAEQKKPLSVQWIFNQAEFLPLRINYNDTLTASININKQQSKIHSASVVYGEGEVVAPLQEGIDLLINQEIFNIDEWLTLINADQNKEHKAKFTFNKVTLNTRKLLWNNKDYGVFDITARRVNQQWEGNLACAAASGSFVIPLTETKTDKITLKMSALNLSELMQSGEQSNDLNIDTFPMFKLSSEQLWWKGENLGQLEIETSRLFDGIQFKPLNITANNYKIALQANWLKIPTGSMTEITGNMQADDVGDFLSKAGITNDLKESRAQVDYFGIWAGSPFKVTMKNIDADMDIEFKDGRISSINPGFGRVLGLLAVEQWIKRLSFNFSDMYKEGLSFNSITGHFKIKEGKAITKSLQVDAVPAKIFINGEADLLLKEFDLDISVIPKSSGAVPIIGTIVSGIAKAVTLAVTDDYKEGYFFGSKYKVTGAWDNVEVNSLHEQDGVLTKTWVDLFGNK